MKYFRCKCGEKTMWSSMGAPHNCQGCTTCNTTYSEYKTGHEELQPHKWGTLYNQKTGRPYKICKKCSEIDEESYNESEIEIDMDAYYRVLQHIYEQEGRDIENFLTHCKSVVIGEAKTYDSPAVLYNPKVEEEGLVIELPPDDEIDDDGNLVHEPTLEELPIPTNLDEAIQTLSNEENIKFVENCTEDELLGQTHHGFGTGIRNGWGLWTGSVLAKWFNEKGIYHADDMSGIIITSFYRKANEIPIDLEGQIKFYRDFWEENNPDVNKGIF